MAGALTLEFDDHFVDFFGAPMSPVDEYAYLTARIAELEAQRLEVGAEVFRSLAPAGQVPDVSALRSAAAELAVATRTAHASAQTVIESGFALAEAYPETLAALQSGQITLAHAKHIAAEGHNLRFDDAKRTEYEQAALAVAYSTTPARTKNQAALIAASLAPRTTVAKHREALEERNIRVFGRDNGMSDLVAHIPTPLAHGIYNRITTLARGVQDLDKQRVADATDTIPATPVEHDPRTIEQVRADLFCDLALAARAETLVGSGLEALTGSVNVTINATTLAGLDDTPAQLDGVGPTTPETARVAAKLAPVWTRLFTNEHGHVIATDTYRPTSEMRRHIHARDQRCRFPGCRREAVMCQIDHTQEHSRGGKTHINYLSALCTLHHPLKHPDLPDHARWSCKQTNPGVLEWTSPTRRVYIDEPPPRVAFVETEAGADDRAGP